MGSLPEGAVLLEPITKGVIVDNIDPENRGRVKVRIPDLHNGVGDKDLPWVFAINLPVGSKVLYMGLIKLNAEKELYERA